MNVGLYKAAASLAACEHWQEITAQNIASATVPGFRRTEASFSGVLADLTRTNAGLGAVSKGVMPEQSTRLVLDAGDFRSTGEELDFAIQGAGFFQVQRPDGSAGFTRDGSFHLNADRVIVNRSGFPLIGDGGPLTLQRGGGHVSVNADGTLLQGDQPVAKVTVFDFAKPDSLKYGADGLLEPKAADVQPVPVERPSILTGTIEGSNVQPLREMVNLITVARAYEASQRTIMAHDESADRAIQALANPNP